MENQVRELTRFETDSGIINVIHEITLGDLLISTLLAAVFILLLISRVVKGE